DPSDNYCETEFTLNVTDTSNPTWIELPQDRILELSEGLQYDVNATDLSGIESYWVNASADFYITGSGYLMGGDTLPVGTHAIELRAYDPYGHYCSCVIIITVEDTVAPEWTPTPSDSDVEYGENFSYYIAASDPSGIHHFWINDTTNFAISNLGELTNISMLVVGDYYLTVRAYDPYGQYCEVEIKVTVEDTTAPSVETIPEQIPGEYGEDFEYTIVAHDLSGIDHFWISDTTHFNVSEAGAITNITSLVMDEYGLVIRVYDVYMNYIEITTEIAIADTTSPTFIDAPSRIDLDYGEALSYQFQATDLSGIDWFYMDDFGGLSLSATGLLTNTSFLDSGIREFDIQVYDMSGNFASHRIIIQVADPPTVSDTGTQMLVIFLSIGGFVAVIVVVIVFLKRR
ncbi:MAG: cadherin repeat domain-containing protein, partial [Candidatus Thorarchaeota archaeon]